jgi:hypothetical protein
METALEKDLFKREGVPQTRQQIANAEELKMMAQEGVPPTDPRRFRPVDLTPPQEMGAPKPEPTDVINSRTPSTTTETLSQSTGMDYTPETLAKSFNIDNNLATGIHAAFKALDVKMDDLASLSIGGVSKGGALNQIEDILLKAQDKKTLSRLPDEQLQKLRDSLAKKFKISQGEVETNLAFAARLMQENAKGKSLFEGRELTPEVLDELGEGEVVNRVASHLDRELDAIIKTNPKYRSFYEGSRADASEQIDAIFKEMGLGTASETDKRMFHLFSSWASPSSAPLPAAFFKFLNQL